MEVIDPRTLLQLDIGTIRDSVKKTHRVMVVSEDCKTAGTGAEIGMQIMENCFDYLDAPVVRLAGADVPMPKSCVLEKLAIPDKVFIYDTIIKENQNVQKNYFNIYCNPIYLCLQCVCNN